MTADMAQMLQDISQRVEGDLRIETQCVAQAELIKHIRAEAEGIMDRAKSFGEAPEAVFAGCLSLLDEANRKQFVLLNMLEEVKRGTPLSRIVRNFNDAGETNIPLPSDPLPPGSPTDPKPGWLIRKLAGAVKSLAVKLIEIAITFMKDAFGEGAVAIEPIVGFSGWYPTVMWKINLTLLEYKADKLQNIFRKISSNAELVAAE
ncbi:MAG: hypothetical protein L0Y57_14050 [Beijerinckiaceae bacterium]|nr:hypothetical protein [Beijerinckiaceae bacterium]